MTCGRVGSWKERPTFEELAVMFEGSTASGAERAYRKAVDKLTELLVAEGAIHAVRLKQKSKTRRKNHNHRLSRWFQTVDKTLLVSTPEAFFLFSVQKVCT